MSTSPSGTLDADLRFSVAIGAVRSLIAHASRMGVSIEDVRVAHGIDEDALRDPDRRVSQGAYNALLATLSERARDEDLGLHLAERGGADDFDVVGHLAARSSTLGEAFERIVAYSRIVHDAGRYELDVEGDEARIFPGCRGLSHELPRHVAELSSAATVLLARVLTQQPIETRHVAFRHARPLRIDEHIRIFGVVPRFGEAEGIVVLPHAALAYPIIGAEPGLVGFLDRYARTVLDRLPQASESIGREATRVVANAIGRGDHTAIDTASVARALATSERTLQRRLREEGTSLSEIVDAVRRRFAEQWLADGDLTQKEIAYLLGFGDPSNYVRAFRRWTGSTPSEVRQALRASGDS